ncbi:MAG: cell division protein ZapA [Gemmatimonadota bacterium]
MREGEVRSAVRVTIFGEDYQIRTELGAEYTRRCAQYVDDAIQEAHIGGRITEPHRAAILAAMKITDELLRLRESMGELQESVGGRLVVMADSLERALDG